jgi:hypothetical protein
MGVLPATVQPILRHSLITVTTGTYVEVIDEAVKRDALDSMATLFETGWRRFVRPVVVNEAAVVVTVVVKTLESPTRKTAISLVELRGFEIPLCRPHKYPLSSRETCRSGVGTYARRRGATCGYVETC